MSGPRDAFVDGYDAYLAGQCETANPYTEGDENHELWADGWRAAQAAENPEG